MSEKQTISDAPFFPEKSPPPYRVSAPQDFCSVMFSSPHSGRHYPDDFQNLLAVPLMDLRRVEDAFVDQLFSHVSEFGAGMISAVYARSFVDLNRAPEELDSRMFKDGPPTPAGERSPRVEAGLGCIPRIAASGKDIHTRMLSRSEADDRLNRAYLPYHTALSNWMDNMAERTGQAVLIDCHSMPSVVAGRRIQADIVLGSRHGSSCDESLTRLVEYGFARLGYRVIRNTPYAGGYLTQRHGSPQDGRHALQIEINRRLYMDETEVRLKSGYHRLQQDIRGIAQSIMEWSRKKKAAPKQARH